MSLRLAEADLLREELGEWSVLLLDDVLAHLDASGQALLLREVDGPQVVLTHTEVPPVKGTCEPVRRAPVGPAQPRIEPYGDGSLGEAYVSVLGSLLLARNGEPLSIIAITSAQDGAGVTTTALNLGAAMARSGHKSLIVDANLRRPHLHEAFGAPQAPGLADILAGSHKTGDVIRPTSVQDLSLLTAGDPAGLPPTLLDANGLAACVRDLRSSYSFVIFDLPPVLKHPDALTVARVSDGIVLVVPAAGTSPKTLKEARRRIERADAKILGAILNRVPRHEVASLP